MGHLAGTSVLLRWLVWFARDGIFDQFAPDDLMNPPVLLLGSPKRSSNASVL